MASKGVAKKAEGRKPLSRGSIPRGRLNSPELIKVLLTVEETAHKLSVGRNTVYGLMNRGELRYITVGRVRRVPVEAISEFVANAGRSASQGADRNGRRTAIA